MALEELRELRLEEALLDLLPQYGVAPPKNGAALAAHVHAVRGPRPDGKMGCRGRCLIPSLFQYDSSMPALGHISKLVRSTKKKAERYRGMRLLFAERCCEMRSARRAKSQHAGLAQSE